MSPDRLIADKRSPVARRVKALEQEWLYKYVPEKEWRERQFPTLWAIATDGTEPLRLRIRSLEVLSRHDLDASAVEELRECLESKSDDLRAAVVRVLGRVPGERSHALLRSLLSDLILSTPAREALVSKLRPAVWDLPDFGKRAKPLRGSHSTFLSRAIDLAVENVESGRGGPFGALIVRSGKVIAEGTNLVTACNEPSAHAEVMAIRAACAFENRIHLDDCVIYSSCEPCPMCLGAIQWARLKGLYFAATRTDAAAAGFDDSFIYDQVPLAPAARTIRATRGLAREGRAPLRAWQASAGSIEY